MIGRYKVSYKASEIEGEVGGVYDCRITRTHHSVVAL